jgi:hypothetical protein
MGSRASAALRVKRNRKEALRAADAAAIRVAGKTETATTRRRPPSRNRPPGG